MRQVHHLIQGSPEWKAHRATPGMINGSEIAAMMSIDPKTSRSELLRLKATGSEKEFSDYVQKNVIDKGHRNEALARPLAEEIIDDDLSPLVMTDTIDGLLFSVSLDGITQCMSITHEHKSLNKDYAADIDAGRVPEQHQPQCEAGLMVSGATRCLFMASTWDDDGQLIEEKHCWYESNPALRLRMIAACKQFLEDLANYEHVETATPVVAEPIKDLPALVITATGSLSVETNFEKWEIELRDFIKRIPEKPSTDQEFEDCKAAVAAFKKAEAALDAEEARVLTMVPSVDDMRRHKKLLRDLSSTTRLALEKLVAKRDIDVKNEIMRSGQDRLDAHINALNQRIGGQWMPRMDSPFAAAIKNKRSYASMRNSVDDALASAKLDANEIADTIQANHNKMVNGDSDHPTGFSYLFPDFAAVCTKATEDFSALLFQRQQQDEQRKMQEESDRATRAEAHADLQAKAQAANDQRGKPADTTHTPQHATAAAPHVTAASTPPIQSDESIIDDYLRLKACSPADKKALRLELVAFEKYRTAREMAAAA